MSWLDFTGRTFAFFQCCSRAALWWSCSRSQHRGSKLDLVIALLTVTENSTSSMCWSYFCSFLIVCSYFIWGFLSTMNNWKNCGGVGTAIAFVTHLCQRKKTGDNVKNYVSLVVESVFIFKGLHLHSKAGQCSNFSHAKWDHLMKSRSLTGTFVHPPNRTWPGDDRWKS